MMWTDVSLKEQGFKLKFEKLKYIFDNECSNIGEKADVLRLEILYQFGGVYVDCDFECLQTFDYLDFGKQCSNDSNNSNDSDSNSDNKGNGIGNGNSNGGYSLMIGLTNTGLLEINNAIIGSCKESKIVEKIILKLIDNVNKINNQTQNNVDEENQTDSKSKNDNDNDNDIRSKKKKSDKLKSNTIVKTGPIFTTRCIMDLITFDNIGKSRSVKDDCVKEILIFPSKLFYPFPNNMRQLPIGDRFAYFDKDMSLAVHHWGVSWSNNETNKQAPKQRQQQENENGSKECKQQSNDKPIKSVESNGIGNKAKAKAKNENENEQEKKEKEKKKENDLVQTLMNSGSVGLQANILKFLS